MRARGRPLVSPGRACLLCPLWPGHRPSADAGPAGALLLDLGPAGLREPVVAYQAPHSVAFCSRRPRSLRPTVSALKQNQAWQGDREGFQTRRPRAALRGCFRAGVRGRRGRGL